MNAAVKEVFESHQTLFTLRVCWLCCSCCLLRSLGFWTMVNGELAMEEPFGHLNVTSWTMSGVLEVLQQGLSLLVCIAALLSAKLVQSHPN